ncbi:hypothetical protein SADUNF_Sadunf07G0046200 [Salix dunnii]|uniref:Uncharacterized protein n=1 Tax=Salix dunnii TaxID=1413687 RepID=A0A835N287_9ROSI|nr:hypothetical protein SADUNF_Sadunf07G0046200 [Salix dunnii]
MIEIVEMDSANKAFERMGRKDVRRRSQSVRCHAKLKCKLEKVQVVICKRSLNAVVTADVGIPIWSCQSTTASPKIDDSMKRAHITAAR